MKKILLLLLSLFIKYGFAQNQVLPNPNLQGRQILPCPYDSAVSVFQVPNWQFYQTTNNQWNGPVDSSRCINANSIYGQTAVVLATIDTARFLFCALSLDSAHQVPLPRNSVYSVETDFYYNPSNIQTGDCDGAPCNQLVLQVDIPDSAGTGRSARTYTGPITNMYGNGSLFCFPTEKFPYQYLKSFVMQVKAHGDSLGYVSFPGFSVQNVDSLGYLPGVYYLTDSMVAQSGNELNLTGPPYVDPGGYGGSLLALYSDTTYPGPNDYSYLRIFPTNPYAATPQVITVDMYSNFDLIFQPYTVFTPAKVYGDPDTTHTLNLILDGSTYCIPPEVEDIVNSNAKLIYKSGDIEFGGTGSCMQFRPQSQLVVSDSCVFNYGNTERPGIILLRENSSIVLKPYSELNMYGDVVFNEYNRAAGPGEFYMTLPLTTTLRFMPGSNIYAGYSVGGAMRLNVYMKGGTLDDSGLSADAKLLINRIYDVQDLQEEIVSVYPNPSNGSTSLRINASQDETAAVQVFNINGRLAYTTTLQLQKGINLTQLNYGNLPDGQYLIRVNGADVFYGKMTVIN